MRRFAMIGLFLMLAGAPLVAQQTPPPTPAPPAVQPGQTPPPGRGRGPAPTTMPTPPTPPPGVPGTAAPPAPGPRPEPPSSWQNIRVEVTITDSLSADQQQRKAVSLLVLDNRNGQVRSMAGQGIINVDTSPMIRPDGRIYLRLTIEYIPELNAQVAQTTGNSSRAMFNESLSLIVQDGKPLLASQAADPRSDRKVTVEVTATVQK